MCPLSFILLTYTLRPYIYQKYIEYLPISQKILILLCSLKGKADKVIMLNIHGGVLHLDHPLYRHDLKVYASTRQFFQTEYDEIYSAMNIFKYFVQNDWCDVQCFIGHSYVCFTFFHILHI